MHVRVFSWRRWRYECRQCRLPWRGKFERCQGQPFEEAYPAPSFSWNSPTILVTYALTRAQESRATGGQW
ncbi:hypothetical protein GCM10007977_110400 [Dactylosporangium sucinum]|uniref:Uncharacterized protein n=1 Tax=Dactylosporangium sucinum TaxID=1424081 RepID=A0A917UI01_9ACTN|nr:hypothetical protein GCM10007977_110400 [Dactylosporangium sucinum]